jgi:hypothetical protein
MPRDTLILQGLLALKASLQSGELDASNCTVAVVGKDQVGSQHIPRAFDRCVLIRFPQPFKIYDGAAVQPFIDALDASEMEVCFSCPLIYPFPSFFCRGVLPEMRWSSNKRSDVLYLCACSWAKHCLNGQTWQSHFSLLLNSEEISQSSVSRCIDLPNLP